jgi:mono/diheme cytochrome c family protein
MEGKMANSIKMAVLFLALAIAQTAAIPSGYSDDENESGNNQRRKTQQSDDNNVVNTPAPTTGTTSSSDGTALYNQYCAGCHGAGKRGSSASAIQSAINSNKGGMGSLKSLTAAQITAIAGGGSTTTSTPIQTFNPTPVPTLNTTPLPDGAALYNQYCSGCHGASKQGKSAAAIQSAINSNKGGMGSLKSLTAAQITAISGAVKTMTPTPIKTFTPTPVPTLNTTPPAASTPTKTWALYNKYCSGCHGTSKQGSSASSIQAAINSNTGGMGSLKSLIAAQIAAIAAGQ